MLDFQIELTCLRCGQTFPARVSLLADNVEQTCSRCVPTPEPRSLRLRRWWKRLKRSLFRSDQMY